MFQFQPSVEALWQCLQGRLQGSGVQMKSKEFENQTSASINKFRILSDDLIRFDSDWAELLLLRPCQIWDRFHGLRKMMPP